ncbi:MAG TPA: ribonuclease P protein component [Burkholderiaceae bacterium]|nr:ribonuclease P protein component [Burkholderiaceae bacterium]
MQAAAVASNTGKADCSFGRARRLRRPRDYAAVLAASRSRSLRLAGEWLSLAAAGLPAVPPGARLGITVSKRMARRAVDRALMKRIVREAFRASAAALERSAVAAGLRIDISIRLKRPIGAPGDARRPSLALWRGLLRDEADQMFAAAVVRFDVAASHA